MELVVDGVSQSFGGVTALRDVSLTAEQNGITALIGPNGAGKTTLFNAITGFVRPDRGSVTFGGRHLERLSPWRIAQHGVVRTFQTPIGFPALTVWENMIAAGTPDRFGGVLKRCEDRRRPDVTTSARELLDDLGLWDLRDRYVDELSTGDRKLLEFARQLMVGPKLLLLDEPAAGVSPVYLERLSTVIRRVRAERGIGSVVIDHNLAFILELADHIHVLDRGALLTSGPPEQIAVDENVMRIYVGSAPEQR